MLLTSLEQDLDVAVCCCVLEMKEEASNHV